MSIKIKISNATPVKPLGDKGHQFEAPVEGQTWTRKFAVWTTQPINPNSLYDITGDLSWKTREYENNGQTKTAVDMNINNPTLTELHNTDEAPF